MILFHHINIKSHKGHISWDLCYLLHLPGRRQVTTGGAGRLVQITNAVSPWLRAVQMESVFFIIPKMESYHVPHG